MAEFQYASIKDLRDEGISETEVDNSRALKLLRDAASLINSVTGQFFAPVTETVLVSGNDASVVSHPQFVPIIEITKVEITSTSFGVSNSNLRSSVFASSGTSWFSPYLSVGGGVAELSPAYVVDNRYVARTSKKVVGIGGSLFTRDLIFPCGNQNVALTGTFGWIENEKKIVTTTKSTIVKGNCHVEVDNAANINTGDIADITDSDGNTVRVIITSVVIDYSASPVTHMLYFDPIQESIVTVAIGATTTVYGRPPRQITKASLILAINDRFKLGSKDCLKTKFKDRIIREKTGIYEYQLQAITTPTLGGTGSTEVDRLLENFFPPPACAAV